MGRTAIEGFPFTGKIQYLTDNKIESYFATVLPISSNRAALDILSNGIYEVVASDTVEAGSTETVINLTSHLAKKGDIIKILTSANNIVEDEISVKGVTTNTVLLNGVLSASLEAGDTVAIYRTVPIQVSASGAAASGPIKFIKDAIEVTVTEDTAVPANSIPLPVKLVGLTGDINITAGDLNVQLSHVGANYDSTRIGDGTNLLGINASNEALVKDTDLTTAVSAMSAKLPASLGQTTGAASLSVVLASDTALPLPTGAATAANQALEITELQDIEADVEAMSAKLPATIGQKAMAASLAVVLASDQSSIPITVASLPLPTGAATETTLAALAAEDFATQTTLATLGTEATLAAMSAKLPASLGTKTAANSLSIVLASDSVLPRPSGRTCVDYSTLDYSVGSVTDSAFREIEPSVAQAATKVDIFETSGEPMLFCIGAASSEAPLFLIPPGGGSFEVNIASGTRVSLKRVYAGTTNLGIMLINFWS